MRSCSRAALRRVSAFRIPTHASRPTLSSCSPRLSSPVPASVGMVTPSEGGTNPGGGALMAEGAMRDCRTCASDDRMATCIDCPVAVAVVHQERARRETYVQSLKVLAHFEHKLLGAFLALWKAVVGSVRLWQREQRDGRRSQREQSSNVLGGSVQLAGCVGARDGSAHPLHFTECVYLTRRSARRPYRIDLVVFARRLFF